jgi:CRP-like cAMP-binding protein
MATSRQKPLRTFLRDVPVFSGLEGRSLDSALSVLRKHTIPAGTVIFTEGELGRTMYVLFKGEAEVYRNNEAGKPVPIVKLGPGECFGEMALVELQPRSASVVITKPSVAYSLDNLDLYKLLREDNYTFVIVLQNICRLLSRRLRKADSRIAEFLSLQPPAAKAVKAARPARSAKAAARPQAARASARRPARKSAR